MKRIENLEEVKDLYATICNRKLGDDARSVLNRVNIVQRLEQITHQRFKNTKDFKVKMDGFILEKELLALSKTSEENKCLKKAREKRGLSQKTLALLLEISIFNLSLMENGRKPLNNKALQFINEGVSSLM